MTIGLVFPGGVATNHNLTAAELQQLDVNASHCLDRVNGDICRQVMSFQAGGNISFDPLTEMVFRTGSNLTVNPGSSTILNGSVSLTGDSTSSLTFASGSTLSASLATFGTISATTYQLATPLIVNRWIPLNCISAQLGGNQDEWGIVVGSFIYQNTYAGSSPSLVIPLRLPHGATLTKLKLRYQGAQGYSSLPTNQVSFSVCSSVVATGTVTVISAVMDAQGSVGAYSVPHDVATGTLSTVVDATVNTYFVTVTPENGGGLDGALLMGCQVSLSIPSVQQA